MWLPGFEPKITGEGHDGSGDCWFTPRHVLDAVSEVLPGWGDPCCDPRSPAVEIAAWSLNIRQGDDGLADAWPMGAAFVNPPYSNASAWLGRCWREAVDGRAIVGLFPLRVEGNAWHRAIWTRGAEVVVPMGRIKFVALDGSTPGAAQIGTGFPCWNCDAHALAGALRRRGVECVVLSAGDGLPF